MNFKRFHESKNLFDKDNADYYDAYINESGYWALAETSRSVRFPCLPNTKYTLKINYTGYNSLFRLCESSDETVAPYSTSAGPRLDIIIRTTNIAEYTFTTSATAKVLVFQGAPFPNENTWIDTLMLNTGSQPLPYEPYSSEVWHDTPHYIHNTYTDTITTLPAVLYPNAVTATVGLKGQMEQSGTPTPTAPIQPQSCGERTNNLFDKTDILSGYEIVNNQIVSNAEWGVSGYIPVEQGKYYIATNTSSPVLEYKTIGDTAVRSGKSIVGGNYTPSATTRFIRISFKLVNLEDIMLNTGSTALPYEPYGVKIPILNNSQTTNVYLGEVQSTRQIKKAVLTGNESWNISSKTVYVNNNDTVPLSPLICSHFPNANNGMFNGNSWKWQVDISNYAMSALSEWIAYLAQQYAAGTPVCVWYVLATPTTGIVNEPLRKIGDYADEVSNVSIPTTAGENTISIGTTLQPSEVTAMYKGWHPVADVHVYPDSSWMPTSWEEFRKAVRSGKAQSLYPVGTKLYENWGDTTSDAWIVVDYPTGEDYLDSDLAQQGYTNRVMLMEEKLNYLRQFDAIEAWLYVETAIPAGTYRFTIPNYDASYGGNKTYIFTSTANVPIGGQLTLTWAYQQNPSAVQAYSSATSTSALFNVSITEWDGTTACTDLGTIKLAQNDADSTYGKLNHIHRARYGSNNYYQSGYRQWLNTNASANWWTPTNVFDRPYGNRTNAGRLNVMNSNMKSVLATPTVNCITNNLFEYPSLDGTTFSLQTAYTVKDKLFPATHSEVNLSSSPNVNSVLDYYVGKGNADRIKYRKDNGNAYYWWLRTPIPAFAYLVRYVNASGALSSYGAHSTIGSAAACIIQ